MEDFAGLMVLVILIAVTIGTAMWFRASWFFPAKKMQFIEEVDPWQQYISRHDRASSLLLLILVLFFWGVLLFSVVTALHH